MTRTFKGFLWCLPALLVLLHDALMFLGSGGTFNFSELGWFLETYLPDSHDSMMQSVGEEYYSNFLKPFFEQKAFYIFGVIGAIGCIWQYCFSKIDDLNPPPVETRDRFKPRQR